MKTTLNKIRSHGPCEDGWERLLRHLGKTKADDEPLSLLTVLESNGFDDALWCLSAVDGHDKEIRLFAVRCARRVQHLMTDPRSIAVLDVSERYANGLATEEELAAARDAAWAAVWAASSAAARDAAWAAASAAASAAWAAARDAAWDAAWAAVWAAVWAASSAAARDAAWAAVWAASSAAARDAAWAAASAAWAAARAAARDAAWDAAWAAASAAARDAQKEEFINLISRTEREDAA